MFILSKTEASMGLHFAGTRGRFQRGMLIAALRLHQAPVIGQTLRRDARELRVEKQECRDIRTGPTLPEPMLGFLFDIETGSFVIVSCCEASNLHAMIHNVPPPSQPLKCRSWELFEDWEGCL